jgi:hypothetical protein
MRLGTVLRRPDPAALFAKRIPAIDPVARDFGLEKRDFGPEKKLSGNWRYASSPMVGGGID